MCNVLGLSVSQDSNILRHCGEEVLFLIHSSNGWGRNEVNNEFWLNPLLFSYCPCIHFSSWDISICGRVILQRKLSSRLLCFLYFALTSFSCQEFIKRKNGSTFRIHWLLGDPSIFLSFVVPSNSLACWVEEWFVRCLFSGVPGCCHSSLACCRKHSPIHLTHWHLLLIYKDQPKKKIPQVKMNQWIKKATTDLGRVARCALAGTTLFAMALTLGTEKHRRRCNSSNRDKPVSWDFLSVRQWLSPVTSKCQLDENRNK